VAAVFPSGPSAVRRPNLRDVLLDPLGELALVLRASQRALRLLHDELEAGQLDGDVLDDGLLFSERFEIHADVFEQVRDQIGFDVNRVDRLATLVDGADLVFRFGGGGEERFDEMPDRVFTASRCSATIPGRLCSSH
jgi:hypothetical protein